MVLSVVVWGALKRARRWRWACRVSVVVGFGSDCSEEPGHVRCDAGHAGFSDVLALSSRAHLSDRGRRARGAVGSVPGVGDEALVDGVADVSLECAHRFFAGLALGLLAEVVDASGCVVADLGDGGHVDRVVQLAVPAWVQPVPLASALTTLRLVRCRCGGRSARRSGTGGRHRRDR